MKRFSVVVFALLFVAASLAFAHGNKKHVLGTVQKIGAGSILVKASDGKSVEVKIVPATIFVKDDHPARLEDLAVGDRVVIHASVKSDALEADEVRFGSARHPAEKTSPQ